MALSLPNPLRENLSFYTIPLAWFIALSPRFYGARKYNEATDGGDLDIRNPRAFSDEVASDSHLKESTRNRIMRAEAAMDNGFEFIGLFAAAVCAGNIARVDNKWLNGLSWGWLGSRVVYNLIYVNNETKALAKARAGVFMAGMGMVFTLFVQAGNKLRQA